MASIEIGPLSHYLDDDELVAVTNALEDADVSVDIDDEADTRLMEGDIDEDIFADFLDRLDAQGAACDIYVPGDFEEVIEASGYSVGSAHALMLALDELRDDLASDDGDADDDDDEGGDDFEEFDSDEDDFGGGGSSSVHIQESELRHLWKSLYKGARAAVRDNVCLLINR
ncbi:hypothetical protein [Haliangium ochraceum]|uniref:DUF1877 domain-containing protein n=1 Tax=Haliangium ochraceum (strain DSM 14365 / JCM 11303 / SMP-2) TaxID=502025 RepID=D0LSF7_HALO1|nr:hypothetical protein [Haliangium ochraceum]ACY15656.1 hypothetical protein Hoch_3154 [Haliangium ochraceum DSM 14365]